MTDIAKAFTKIFWGFFLMFFDFNIFIFDILPDFVGYFIVVSALSHLQSFSFSFKRAKVIALILGILSIPAYFIGKINFLEGFVPSTTTILILVASTILTLIQLILIYYLLEGCIHLAGKHNLSPLAKTTSNYLTTYIILSLVVAILLPFVLNISENTALILVSIGALTSIIVNIMILFLIWQYRKTFLNMEN